MRAGIQTWGSEGDIRPFVALGHALASRGHDVELLYTEIGERRYEAVAASLGFTARAVASPVIADPFELYEIGLEAIHTRDQLRQGLRISRRLLEPVVEPIYEAGLELAKRSDVFVHHFILHPARAAADTAKTRAITVALAHMLIPSRHIHPTGLPRLGEWGNAIGWKLARVALNQTLLRDVNRWRSRVGLPRFSDLMDQAWASPLLHLIATSPALLDRPPDWPASHHMCGFLTLPSHEHETASPALEAFLSRGPAPVFFGFGSLMPTSGPHLADTVTIFLEAARASGQRAIIQAAGSHDAPDTVLFVERTPHALVFPRCAAVVHHAGAGTTHTTLRAGVPSVPVPHVSDQFAWSDELHRLGIAPRPLRRTKLTAASLASRIRETAGNAAMKAAAARISARMQSDDGPATAAMLIERAAGWNRT